MNPILAHHLLAALLSVAFTSVVHAQLPNVLQINAA